MVGVATNQSGISRGLLDLPTLNAMHQKMHQMLAKLGAHVDMIAFCPHLPDDGCDCRKPRPGLYQALAERWNISLDGIPVIGDSLRDLEAARAVKASPILVRTGKGRRTEAQLEEGQDIPVFDNLALTVDYLLRDND